MPQSLDLTGQRFGRFVALKPVRPEYWRCRCDCGHEKDVRIDHLRNGRTRSCGCLLRETVSRRRLKHGAAIGKERNPYYREYTVWQHIRRRCHHSGCRQYRWYGARGIHVAPEWREDFAAFLADVGPKPSTTATLDRIDNDRGYEPGNVRWTDKITQMNNMRSNHRLTWQGQTHTVTEWARILGCNPYALFRRLYTGWSVEHTLTTPIGTPRVTKSSG
ncbi:MAG TPA: hypothetical protein VFF65_04235 [Phycisphaerales bacterium]|nr:hypothetical protein [Phycisphaerales bacterium]